MKYETLIRDRGRRKFDKELKEKGIVGWLKENVDVEDGQSLVHDENGENFVLKLLDDLKKSKENEKES